MIISLVRQDGLHSDLDLNGTNMISESLNLRNVRLSRYTDNLDLLFTNNVLKIHVLVTGIWKSLSVPITEH